MKYFVVIGLMVGSMNAHASDVVCYGKGEKISGNPRSSERSSKLTPYTNPAGEAFLHTFVDDYSFWLQDHVKSYSLSVAKTNNLDLDTEYTVVAVEIPRFKKSGDEFRLTTTHEGRGLELYCTML